MKSKIGVEEALKGRSKPSVVYWFGNTLYLNVTNRCTNDCYFCFRRFTDGVWNFNLRLEREPSTGEVIHSLREALKRGYWKRVTFCGFGEPTLRLPLLLEVARWLKKNHPALTLGLDTNGQGYLINEGVNVVQELVKAGLDRVSVSLNAQDEETYRIVCKPKLDGAYKAVLNFIRDSRDAGLETEVTAVAIPEVNLEKIRAQAESMGVTFRLRIYEGPLSFL